MHRPAFRLSESYPDSWLPSETLWATLLDSFLFFKTYHKLPLFCSFAKHLSHLERATSPSIHLWQLPPKALSNATWRTNASRA